LNKIYASTTIRQNNCPNSTLTTSGTGTSTTTTTTTCTDTINNDLLPTSCITQIQKSPNGSIRSKKVMIFIFLYTVYLLINFLYNFIFFLLK